jgi:hypothetical protein
MDLQLAQWRGNTIWRCMNLATECGPSGLTRPANDLKIVPRINTRLRCGTRVVEDDQAHVWHRIEIPLRV